MKENLSLSGSFKTVNLPEDKRKNVLKFVNPKGWCVTYVSLTKFKDHIVNIKFSVDVKRVGSDGELQWQVNNNGYPVIGKKINNAKADKWHTMSGEWTGPIIGSRVFYLSTWKNNSDTTTYFIDNFKIEIESKGKRVKTIPSQYQKTLVDMAKYLKGVIPANIPESFTLKPMYKKYSNEENIREGVLAYRDFLYLICDNLIADGKLYDKPPKNDDAHMNMAARFPFLNNVKSILFNFGYHGKLVDNNNAIILGKPQLLTSAINSEGGVLKTRISVPKLIEALRFLSDCGVCYEGINLYTDRPNMSEVTSIEITYPDNPSILTGLKIMAIAQKESDAKYNDEAFLRCAYRILKNEEPDVASLFNDYIQPLPVKLQKFALKIHQHNLDKGLICKPKVSSLDLQFYYFHKNKEICSYFASLTGYRFLVKAQNTGKYADVIKKFSAPLQEKLAKGYGCEKKRYDEPCQKGCHGFTFPLDDSVLDISNDLISLIDNEVSC